MPRLKMNVISTVKRFLAMGGNVSPKMCFIWRLIQRETCVTIKTIHGILGCKVFYGRVKFRNAGNGLSHPFFKISPYRLILFLMPVKPLTGVISLYGFKEIQNSFSLHNKIKLNLIILCKLK